MAAAEPGPEDSSEHLSEERTEPISQSELDARYKGIRVEEPGYFTAGEHVPLDILQLEDHHHRQGIRILVRPLTSSETTRSFSPASGSCQWLALRAQVASTEHAEHRVLAVSQTSKDAKFSVRIPGEYHDDCPRPGLWCELYYDPASDQVILLNKSDVPISLGKASLSPPNSPSSDDGHTINPGLAKALRPSTWRIKVRGVAVLDFRLLEKRPVVVYPPRSAPTHQSTSSATFNRSSSLKRPRCPEAEGKGTKRRILDSSHQEADDRVILLFRPAAESSVLPLPNEQKSKHLSTSSAHALLDVDQDETVAVSGACEPDEYQLTRRELIASTALSEVYAAVHSRIPDTIVTVKVLKTRVANAGDVPYVHERNVIRQADMWLREFRSHENLEHESIVRFHGGDARYLSLYMEHIEAKNLATENRWRNPQDDCFKGGVDDALRILRGSASALGYIHSRKLVHNDIKPANILYSPERGAVLCDFGLSTPATISPSSGGTPYYMPPEFIGTKLRGAASDVWALGVTMLYVLGKMAYPESRASRRHPKPLYWHIGGINNPNAPHRHYGNGHPAVSQMRAWLEEVFEAREGLNPEDRLERLVKEMLTANPNHRITTTELLRELLSVPVRAG